MIFYINQCFTIPLMIVCLLLRVNGCTGNSKRQNIGGIKLVAAKAVISPSCSLDSTQEQVSGMVYISQPANGGPATFAVTLRGLNPESKHGFHVHRFGDVSQENGGCEGASGHYNPQTNEHGGPEDTNRHVGDLGNLIADLYGNVDATIKDTKATLLGKHSIGGRSFVVHEKEDDLGKGVNGEQEESKKTGNAGTRLACGSIIFTSPESLPAAMR